MARTTDYKAIASACFAATSAAGEWELSERNESSADDRHAALRALLTWHGGACLYTCQIRPYLTRDGLNALMERARHLEDRGEIPLILTRHVTPQIGNILRAHGLQFADTAGNAYLAGEGLHVWITGNAAPRGPGELKGPFTVSGLKLIFVLLKQPNAIRATQRDLASRAGIALGSVGRILRSLFDRGYLIHTGSDDLGLTKLEDLHVLWDTGYTETLRPRLHVGDFSPGPERDIERWFVKHGAILTDKAVHVGGEIGTAVLTQAIRPTRLTLHAQDRDIEALRKELQLYPDPQGSVSILRQFGEVGNGKETNSGLLLADPLLLRAELLAHPHERLREARDGLLHEHILPRFAHDS